MAATDHAQVRRTRALAPQLIAMLAGYAVALGAGAAGLIAALDAGQAWGWALAGLALAWGVALAVRLARAAAPARPPRCR